MMEHHFNIDIAIKHGVNEAIFLHNIAFWILHNKANDKNFHDGRHWTFNTLQAFLSIFPYWSQKNIRTIIKSCMEQSLLIKDNFNKSGYDHTSWYTLSDKGLLLFPFLSTIDPKRQIDVPKPANQSECGFQGIDTPKTPVVVDLPETAHRRAQTGTPIPDINTYTKQKIRERGAEKDRAVSPLSQDFKIDEENQKLLQDTVLKSGKSENDLITKFKALMKTKKIPIIQWQNRLTMFLIDEKPASTVPFSNVISRPVATNEVRSTVKEWAPGNPDYDRVNAVQRPPRHH